MLFNAFLSKLFKIMKIYAWKVQFQLGKNQQYLQGERDVAKWTVEIREIIGLKALEINVWILAVLRENRYMIVAKWRKQELCPFSHFFFLAV